MESPAEDSDTQQLSVDDCLSLDDEGEDNSSCAGRAFRGRFLQECKETLRLTWGLVLLTVSQIFMSPLTTMFAGHLGKEELDAVLLANSIIIVLGRSIVTGMATACDTYFAQAFGNKNFKLVGVILQKAIAIHLIMLVLLCTLYINMERLLLILGQDPEVARLTGLYVLVFIPGMLVRYHSHGFLSKSSYVSPTESSTAPFISCIIPQIILKAYLSCQNIVVPCVVIGFIGLGVNALLQYVFVYKLNLSVIGSAAGQAIATFCIAALTLVYIIGSKVYKKTWGGWSWQMLEGWGSFTKLGLYGIVMVCLEWWAFEVSVLLSGILGTTELGAQGVFFNVESFFVAVGVGLGDATAIRVGQALGAGKPSQAALAARVGFVLALGTSVVISILILTLRYELPKVFTNVPEVIEATAVMLPVMAFYTPFDNLSFIGRGVTRGCGLQGMATLMIVVAYYIIGLPIGIPLMFLTPIRNLGVWVGLCIAVTICAIVFVVYISCFLDWRKVSQEAVERTGKGRKMIRESDRRSSISNTSQQDTCRNSNVDDDVPEDVADETTGLLQNATSRDSRYGSSNEEQASCNETADVPRGRELLCRRVGTVAIACAVLTAGVLCRVFLPVSHVDSRAFVNVTTVSYFTPDNATDDTQS